MISNPCKRCNKNEINYTHGHRGSKLCLGCKGKFKKRFPVQGVPQPPHISKLQVYLKELKIGLTNKYRKEFKNETASIKSTVSENENNKL